MRRAILFTLLALPVLAQDTENSWIAPGDEELASAAAYGFAGHSPRARTICSGLGADRRCPDYLWIVDVRGPLQLAEELGFEAHKTFGDAPSGAALAKLRGAARVNVLFCSGWREEQIAVALEVEGRPVRPAKVTRTADLAAILCGSVRPYANSTGALFDGSDPLPARGHGAVLIRSGNKPDVRIPFEYAALR